MRRREDHGHPQAVVAEPLLRPAGAARPQPAAGRQLPQPRQRHGATASPAWSSATGACSSRRRAATPSSSSLAVRLPMDAHHRDAEGHQGLSRRARHQGRRLRSAPGRDPCAARRERRRQVDADQDHGRRGRADRRARCSIAARPCNSPRRRRRWSRHRHGVPGDQPGALDDGGAEPLSRRARDSSTGCAASTSRRSSSCSR